MEILKQFGQRVREPLSAVKQFQISLDDGDKAKEKLKTALYSLNYEAELQSRMLLGLDTESDITPALSAIEGIAIATDLKPAAESESKNPYFDAVNVIRGLIEEGEYYNRADKDELRRTMAAAVSKAQSEGRQPRILIVGAGGGLIVRDLEKEFPAAKFNFVNKRAIYLSKSEFSQAVTALRGSADEQWLDEFLDRFRNQQILADLDHGLPVDYQGAFDAVLVTSRVFKYSKEKDEFIHHVKQSLRPGGIAIINGVDGFHVNGTSPRKFFERLNRYFLPDGVQEYEYRPYHRTLKITNQSTGISFPKLKIVDQRMDQLSWKGQPLDPRFSNFYSAANVHGHDLTDEAAGEASSLGEARGNLAAMFENREALVMALNPGLRVGYLEGKRAEHGFDATQLTFSAQSLGELPDESPLGKQIRVDQGASPVQGTVFHRNENLRSQFSRILRQVSFGQIIDGILRQRKSLTAHDIQRLQLALQSRNPLVQIIDPAIGAGDILIVFEVPGYGEKGMGQKQLNEVLGYAAASDLINIRKRILLSNMEREFGPAKTGTTSLRERAGIMGFGPAAKEISASYKEQVFRIKGVSVTPEEFKRKFEAVRDRAIMQLNQIMREDPRFQTKLNENQGLLAKYGIQNFMTDPLLDIRFGSALVERSSPEARLEAHMNARRAIKLPGSARFSRDEYEKVIREAVQMARDLEAQAPGLFRIDEASGEKVMTDAILKQLRAHTFWQDLPGPIQDNFQHKPDHYQKAQAYFDLLGLQDYLKRWQLDWNEALREAREMQRLLARLDVLKPRLQSAKTPAARKKLDTELKRIQKRVKFFILREPKSRAVTSALAFHLHAPFIRKPVYISFDVIGLGYLNLTQFQIEIKRIHQLLEGKVKRWDEIQRIGRTGADSVTQKLIRMQEIVTEEYAALKGKDQLFLMGGDELNLILDGTVLDGARLDAFLFRVRERIRKETGLNVRIGVQTPERIELYRLQHAGRGYLQNHLAHAQAMIEDDQITKRIKHLEGLQAEGRLSLEFHDAIVMGEGRGPGDPEWMGMTQTPDGSLHRFPIGGEIAAQSLGAELKPVSERRSGQILKATEIHGSTFRGETLEVADLKHLGMVPRYWLRVGKRTVYLAKSVFDLQLGGRLGIIAFVEDDPKPGDNPKKKRYVARTYYRSNSHGGSWRYLPTILTLDGRIRLLDKGYGEDSLPVPYQVIKAINAVRFENGIAQVADETERLRLFAGTTRVVGAEPRPGDTRQPGDTYSRIVSPKGDILNDDSHTIRGLSGKTPPENVKLDDPRNKPNFRKVIDEFEIETGLNTDGIPDRFRLYPAHGDPQVQKISLSEETGGAVHFTLPGGLKLIFGGLKMNRDLQDMKWPGAAGSRPKSRFDGNGRLLGFDYPDGSHLELDYGIAKARVFDSHNGKLRYVFVTDKFRRSMIASIEILGDVTAIGIRSQWPYAGSLVTPLYDYYELAGRYGDQNDSKGPYTSMWQNYLSHVGLIQEYHELFVGGPLTETPSHLGEGLSLGLDPRLKLDQIPAEEFEMGQILKELALDLTRVSGKPVTPLEMVHWLAGQNLVDLGSGAGSDLVRWLWRHGSRKAHALDRAIPKWAAERYKKVWRQNFLSSWPFKKDELRVALSFQALGWEVPVVYPGAWSRHRQRDYQKIVSELDRTLAENGIALWTLGEKGNPALKQALRTAGFKIRTQTHRSPHTNYQLWFITKQPFKNVLRQIAKEIIPDNTAQSLGDSALSLAAEIQQKIIAKFGPAARQVNFSPQKINAQMVLHILKPLDPKYLVRFFEKRAHQHGITLEQYHDLWKQDKDNETVWQEMENLVRIFTFSGSRLQNNYPMQNFNNSLAMFEGLKALILSRLEGKEESPNPMIFRFTALGDGHELQAVFSMLEKVLNNILAEPAHKDALKRGGISDMAGLAGALNLDFRFYDLQNDKLQNAEAEMAKIESAHEWFRPIAAYEFVNLTKPETYEDWKKEPTVFLMARNVFNYGAPSFSIFLETVTRSLETGGLLVTNYDDGGKILLAQSGEAFPELEAIENPALEGFVLDDYYVRIMRRLPRTTVSAESLGDISGIELPMLYGDGAMLEPLALEVGGGVVNPFVLMGGIFTVGVGPGVREYKEFLERVVTEGASLGKSKEETSQTVQSLRDKSRDGLGINPEKRRMAHENPVVFLAMLKALKEGDRSDLRARLADIPMGSVVIGYDDRFAPSGLDLGSLLPAGVQYSRTIYERTLSLKTVKTNLARVAEKDARLAGHAVFLFSSFQDVFPEKGNRGEDLKEIGFSLQLNAELLRQQPRILQSRIIPAIAGETLQFAKLDREARDQVLAQNRESGFLGFSDGAYAFDLNLWLDARASQIISSAV